MSAWAASNEKSPANRNGSPGQIMLHGCCLAKLVTACLFARSRFVALAVGLGHFTGCRQSADALLGEPRTDCPHAFAHGWRADRVHAAMSEVVVGASSLHGRADVTGGSCVGRNQGGGGNGRDSQGGCEAAKRSGCCQLNPLWHGRRRACDVDLGRCCRRLACAGFCLLAEGKRTGTPASGRPIVWCPAIADKKLQHVLRRQMRDKHHTKPLMILVSLMVRKYRKYPRQVGRYLRTGTLLDASSSKG